MKGLRLIGIACKKVVAKINSEPTTIAEDRWVPSNVTAKTVAIKGSNAPKIPAAVGLMKFKLPKNIVYAAIVPKKIT